MTETGLMPRLRSLALGLALAGLAGPLAAAPLTRDAVPEPLRPWVDWVLRGHEAETCPFLHAQGERHCVWPGRLELAKAFGADHTINVKEVTDRRERVKLVRQWTGGVGADVACDLVGFPAVIPEGIEMLRSGGTYLEIGTISRGAKVELEPSLLVWGSKKILGVIQYDAWVIPRVLDFLVRTRESRPWSRILSHKYPLEKINEAFAASEWHNRETTTITRAALIP